MAAVDDNEDFQDQLRMLDGAAAKLQGMLIKMDKGECTPLDAWPPLKNFQRKRQSFAVEMTDLNADILKTSYPSKSLGGNHNPKSLRKKFKELGTPTVQSAALADKVLTLPEAELLQCARDERQRLEDAGEIDQVGDNQPDTMTRWSAQCWKCAGGTGLQ